MNSVVTEELVCGVFTNKNRVSCLFTHMLIEHEGHLSSGLDGLFQGLVVVVIAYLVPWWLTIPCCFGYGRCYLSLLLETDLFISNSLVWFYPFLQT